MPPKEDEGNALHLISDILDKLIDTQRATATTSTELKSAIEENQEILREIRRHFINGFKIEIKDHVTTSLKECFSRSETQQEKTLDILYQIKNKLDKISESLTKPWFWIKLIGTVIGALGVMIGVLIEVLRRLWMVT